MAVTHATLRAVEDLRRRMTTMTDAQTLALTRAWADAWDVLLPEFEAAIVELVAEPGEKGYVTRATAARNKRLAAALRAARTYLDTLAPQAATTISQDLTTVMLETVEGHTDIVTTQLPPGTPAASVGFTHVPEEALAAIVERTTEQIHSSTRPLPADIERTMKKALIRGIAVGENPRKTARRLVRETEQRFNGGLTRALVISRTEMLDAHRAATKAQEKGNKQVLEDWEWHAKLDGRTCPSCWAQHGSRHPLEEDGPLDHQQGRCARVSVTKSWKDLGFDIEEPPSLTPDARTTFDSLDPATQREILGPARLDLLQSGAISWEDLSTKRSTSGWRDSYGVTPLKNLAPEGG